MQGFTLVEMLVVIGLIGVVAGFSVIVGLDSFRGDSYRAERDSVILLMQRARTEALNNINQSRHGVAFFPTDHPQSYVEFEGDTYATRDTTMDIVIDSQYSVSVGAGAPTEIVFDQLTGNSSYSGTFAFVDTARQISSNITITSEGGISW